MTRKVKSKLNQIKNKSSYSNSMPCFLFPFSLFFSGKHFFFLPISCQQSIFTRVVSLVGALYLRRRENLTDHLQGDGKTFCSRKSLQRGKMNCSSTRSSAGGRETGNCFHWHSYPQSYTHPTHHKRGPTWSTMRLI